MYYQEINVLKLVKLTIVTKKKFFLSGGIDLESIDKIQKIKKENEYLFAVDINSKFEFSPGNKDIKKIKRFLKKLNDGKF